MGERPGKSLFDVAAAPADVERVVFSEYHAAGSNTAELASPTPNVLEPTHVPSTKAPDPYMP